MKKGFSIALALLMSVLGLAACANDSTEEVQLVVFAAASMSGVLTEIADAYSESNQNVNLVFNFDSSGTLRTQIREGAYADVFISAAGRQMDEIDVNAEINTEGHDFILEGSRLDFLENQVVLVAPTGNPSGVESFAQMADALLAGDVMMVMGNSDVPVGQHATEILSYFNLEDAELARSGVISYGANVREVSSQVREASVDLGIVYLTDAMYDEIVIVDFANSDMTRRVIYPAAVINGSNHQDEASDFINFLTGDIAGAIFTEWGFTPLT